MNTLWAHVASPVAVRGHGTFFLPLVLTCPKGSRWLLVSLSFWKETSCLIQWAPVAGESGCTYSRPGMAGSAFPVTDLRGDRGTELRGGVGGLSRGLLLPHSSPPVGVSPTRVSPYTGPDSQAVLREKRHLQPLLGELIELFGTFPVGDGSHCFPV